ncbi:sugar kinase (plasmid) [Aminobacter sp. Y103A]|nr:sugar kinase [Aminobacter sp. SS-2016]
MGIDFGTTQIRASIYAPDGTLVAGGKVATPTIRPDTDSAHHEPEAVWAATLAVIRAALDGIAEPSLVRGIACASVGEAGLLIGAKGEELTPIIAWYDRRAIAECRDFVGRLGADALYGITGQPPEPILGIYKLLWLMARQPNLFARPAQWLNVADYLAFRLSGRICAESSLACRTGVFDLQRRTWATELLKQAGLRPDLFPELQANGAPLGTIRQPVAAATGLPASCVVAVGGHDQAMSALVCSGLADGMLSATLGTTEALLAAVTSPSRSAMLGRQGFCQGVLTAGRPRHYVLGGVFTAGASIEWFRQTILGGIAHEPLIATAAAIPIGSRGVCFRPQLALGSAPHPSPHANGSFWGLSMAADPGAMFRAILEGLAYEARLCIEALAALPEVGAIRRINAVGGDTRNLLRMSIKASVSGTPIDIIDVEDATSLGAALMAGLGAGVYADLDSALAALALPRTTILPVPEDQAFYDAYFRSVYRHAPAALASLREPRPGSKLGAAYVHLGTQGSL